MPMFDLSHTVEDGMVTYRGLPAAVVCDFLSREASREVYAPGTEFHIGKIEMVANTGTYVDAPFHRYPDGKDLSELPLEPLAGREAVVIDAGESRRSAPSSCADSTYAGARCCSAPAGAATGAAIATSRATRT